VRLQARIGVASGIVVVGDLVREGVTQENAAIGATTNQAARLQSLAEPNTIVISPETHRLIGALFEYRDLGDHALKGFAKPVHVRQVVRGRAIWKTGSRRGNKRRHRCLAAKRSSISSCGAGNMPRPAQGESC
jgi:class 3 adenylate cyclase